MTKTETIIRILAAREPENTIKWTTEEWEAAQKSEGTQLLAWFPNGVELEDSSRYGGASPE